MAVLTSREQAVRLLKILPLNSTDEPCSEHNPELWREWCAVQGRPPDPSTLWRESDVAMSCVLMIQSFMRNCLRDE
jgi:hypothetical protein